MPAYEKVASVPHVQYAAGEDARGKWWIFCKCDVCGDDFRRPCSRPANTSNVVNTYLRLHLHPGGR